MPLCATGTEPTGRKHYVKPPAPRRTAAAISSEPNFPRAELNALGSLGNVAMWQEHYAEAIDRFQKALERSRFLTARRAEANALGNLGWSYLAIGDFQNAQIKFREAEAASASAGVPEDRAYWLHTLGDAYYRQGRYLD